MCVALYVCYLVSSVSVSMSREVSCYAMATRPEECATEDKC